MCLINISLNHITTFNLAATFGWTGGRGQESHLGFWDHMQLWAIGYLFLPYEDRGDEKMLFTVYFPCRNYLFYKFLQPDLIWKKL